MYISFTEISAEQKKPLSHKIQTAIRAVQSGYNACKSQAAIAFSGGKDSTVLLHLMRTHFPEQFAKTYVIFGNTGVEFPESLHFARDLGKRWAGDNFHEATPDRLQKDELKYAAQKQVMQYLTQTNQIQSILKRDGKLKSEKALERACPPEMMQQFRQHGLIWKAGTVKSYWWCADKYGYPILGKAFGTLKAKRASIDCFLEFGGSTSQNMETLQYYQVLRKVKISQMCCDILKKEPSERIQQRLKVDVMFKGLMAAESQQRQLNFATRGYLFQSKRKYTAPFHHCNPLQNWTDDDIWQYIRQYNVPYSPLYDITYADKNQNACRIKRNGCIGCYTDYGRNNNHMFQLKQTHPTKWKAVMKYGMAKEIQKLKAIGAITGNKKYLGSSSTLSALFATIQDEEQDAIDRHVMWAIENRPCAFD